MKGYILVCLLILFVTPAVIQAQQHYSSESDIAHAVNVALSKLIVSQSYAIAIYEYGMNASLIEPCNPTYGYPHTLTVPNNTIRACRDTIVGPPWIFDNGTAGFYDTLGSMLIAQLNNKYGNLKLQFVDVPTTQNGYFTSLSDAINAGQCDIGISSMAITANREQYVDFGCAHSATWMAIMRGGLDPNMTLTDMSQLNHSDVEIALLKGSAWLRIAAENCPMASIVQENSFFDCLDAVKNEDVHATFLHNVVIKYWLNQNSCPACKRYKFGSAPLQFGMFFKKGALTGGSNSTSDATKIPYSGSSWLLFSAILAFIVNLF